MICSSCFLRHLAQAYPRLNATSMHPTATPRNVGHPFLKLPAIDWLYGVAATTWAGRAPLALTLLGWGGSGGGDGGAATGGGSVSGGVAGADRGGGRALPGARGGALAGGAACCRKNGTDGSTSVAPLVAAEEAFAAGGGWPTAAAPNGQRLSDHKAFNGGAGQSCPCGQTAATHSPVAKWRIAPLAPSMAQSCGCCGEPPAPQGASATGAPDAHGCPEEHAVTVRHSSDCCVPPG